MPQKPAVNEQKSKLLMMSGDMDDVVFDQTDEKEDSEVLEPQLRASLRKPTNKSHMQMSI